MSKFLSIRQNRKKQITKCVFGPQFFGHLEEINISLRWTLYFFISTEKTRFLLINTKACPWPCQVDTIYNNQKNFRCMNHRMFYSDVFKFSHDGCGSSSTINSHNLWGQAKIPDQKSWPKSSFSSKMTYFVNCKGNCWARIRILKFRTRIFYRSWGSRYFITKKSHFLK